MEEKYANTYRCFLKECAHLAEYDSLLKKGRVYPTTIMGLSLLNMLNEYAVLKAQHQQQGQLVMKFGTSFSLSLIRPILISNLVSGFKYYKIK